MSAPKIPPVALVVLCSRPIEEQAKGAGLSVRHFSRIAREPDWDRIRIGTARAWCAACGVDLFSMDVSKLVPQVPWRRMTKPIARALRAVMRAATGKEPSASEVRAMAARLDP